MSRPAVGATFVVDTHQVLDAEQPGLYTFTESGGIKRIFCKCPCGCGGHMHLPIYKAGEVKPAVSAWEWDGNVDSPTLNPSIRDLSGCKFHGHLRGGYWTFCDDSGL